jgi:hypothetical protein
LQLRQSTLGKLNSSKKAVFAGKTSAGAHLMVQIDGESRQHTLVIKLAAGSGTLTSKQSTHRALQQRRNERNVAGKNVAKTEKKEKEREKKNKL